MVYGFYMGWLLNHTVFILLYKIGNGKITILKLCQIVKGNAAIQNFMFPNRKFKVFELYLKFISSCSGVRHSNQRAI